MKRMRNEKAKFIFNAIAFVYLLLTKVIISSYRCTMKTLLKEVDVSSKRVLDVGAGTGAWSYLFYEEGAKVVAIDFASKMLSALKSFHKGKIKFMLMDALEMSEIEEKSVDIVTASYVLHGMTQDDRREVLLEMKRIAKEFVVIRDFKGPFSLPIYILEYLEGSDYLNFIKTFEAEMKEVFENAYRVDVKNPHDALYIAKL